MLRAATILFLFCAIAQIAAVRKNVGVVERALQSAQRRVSQKDSLCHGSAHRHRNLTENVYLSFAKRRALEQEENADHSLVTLYNWCRGDEACRKAYYLKPVDATNAQPAVVDDYEEFEMFRYLASRWHDRAYPLTQLLDESGICGSSSGSGSSLDRRSADDRDADIFAQPAQTGEDILENALKKAWLLEMRLQTCSRSQVQCAENQRFIYSPADAEGHCVCSATDNDCHTVYRRQHTTPWTYTIWAVVLASIALFVSAALNVYMKFVQIPVFRRITAELERPESAAVTPNVTAQANRFLQALLE